MTCKRHNPDKAKRLEEKGDRLLAKGKVKRAIKKYKKALECDESRRGIYDKLIEARDKLPGEWDECDFVESVDWAMRKQEQEHPPIRQLHAKLSPEWEEAKKLAIGILNADDDEGAEELVEKLVSMGETGTRAAVGLLLDLKSASRKTPPDSEGEPNE